jgi:PAS domain S-box-containing protein
MHYLSFKGLIMSTKKNNDSSKDITHEKKLQEELKREKNRYQTILHLATDGIHILDHKGNVVECSQSFADSLGYSLEEAKKLNVTQWDASIPKDEIDATLDDIFRNPQDKILSFETKHKRKDGTIFDVNLIASIIVIENTKYMYASSRDITEIKRKDAMLLQQSRLASMGEMVSMIAHQWRQPLAVINTKIANIKLDNMLKDTIDETLEEKLQGIEEIVFHLSKTIDDFRYFDQHHSLENKDLIEVIDKSIGIVRGLYIANGGIEIRTNYHAQECQIKINDRELSQVLLSLLSNAKDAIIEKSITDPYINITTQVDKENLYIIVEDNGGGIDMAILEHIFEPYTSTKKLNGTGLGLYMTHVIVTQHFHGSITAKNCVQGAKFTITIAHDANV